MSLGFYGPLFIAKQTFQVYLIKNRDTNSFVVFRIVICDFVALDLIKKKH